MTRRLTVALAALALLLSACAHGAGRQVDTGSSPAPPPSSSGQLTVAEYRVIVREYRALKPLQDGSASGALLKRGPQVCAQLRKPRTRLVELVRRDCDNAIAFFAAFQGIERVTTDCTGATQVDPLVCLRKRYTAMATAIERTRSGAAAINAELRRRDITGLCATSIGITVPQLDAYRRAARAAHAVIRAVAHNDSAAFDRATSELTAALGASSGGDPLRGIERACRPPHTKPLPRLPRGGGVKA